MKVVLITGASKGIGAATAINMAKEGYNVVINYNTDEVGAIKTLEEVKKYSDGMIIKADISNEVEVANMVNTIVSKYNSIDVLVNNASIAIDSIYEDKNVEDFKKILDVNLIGTFLVSKYVGDIMYKNKSGVIINISSTNGIDTNYVERLDYDASKAGVISLGRNLALKYAPYIRVNTVCPGWVDTDMNKDMDIDYKKLEEDKILLGRFALKEEIANVITFLASDKASYINNSIIRVDGGKK